MGRHKELHGEDIHVPSQFYIAELRLERASDSEIIIKEGECASDDEDFELMRLESDLVVNIEDSGVNGLDTGSEAALTWYYIYIIKNQDSGAVAGLISASPDDPTLPEGFTKKRRIGSVGNDSSSNFFYFDQHDFGNLRRYSYHYPFSMIAAGQASVYTAFGCGIVVPPVAEMVKVGYYLEWIGSGEGIVTGYLRRTGVWADQYRIRGYHRHEIIFFAMCSSAQQFDYKVEADSQCWVNVHGFDERI